ncbi:hypothetical protein TruAng_003498 [Truncatella angustata]|nr:hypothetical protein TruAng_003498 [Truncatella angustata]
MIGVADEVGPSTYEANEATHFNVKKQILGDSKYYNDIALKVYSNMGSLMAQDIETDGHLFTFGKPMLDYTAENQ